MKCVRVKGPTNRSICFSDRDRCTRCGQFALHRYESGVDPLIAMKIVGHTDYQTTANIYTHLKEETLRRASVNMEKVFAEREKVGE